MQQTCKKMMASNEVEHNEVITAIIHCNQKALDDLRERNQERTNSLLYDCLRDIFKKHILISREALTFLNDNLIACGRRKAFPVECLDVKDLTHQHKKSLIAYAVHVMQEIETHQEETDILFLHNVDMVLRVINKLQYFIKGFPWKKVIFVLHRYINFYHIHTDGIFDKIAFEINHFNILVLSQAKLKTILADFKKVFEMLLKNVKHKDVKAKFMAESMPNLEAHYWEARDFYTLALMDYNFRETNKDLERSCNEVQNVLIICKLIQTLGELFKSTIETPNISAKLRKVFEEYIPEQVINDIIEFRNVVSHTENLPNGIDSTLLQDVINCTKSLHGIVKHIAYTLKIETKQSNTSPLDQAKEPNYRVTFYKGLLRIRASCLNFKSSCEKLNPTNCFSDLRNYITNASKSSTAHAETTVRAIDSSEKSAQSVKMILLALYEQLQKLTGNVQQDKARNIIAHINYERNIELQTDLEILLQQLWRIGDREIGIPSICMIQEEAQKQYDTICSDPWKQTKLHIAVIENNLKEVKKLLKNEHSCIVTDAAGNDAIVYAIRCNSLPIITKLMKKLPHPNDSKYLSDACLFGCADIVGYLLENQKSSFKSAEIRLAFEIAAKNSNIACMEEILKQQDAGVEICLKVAKSKEEEAFYETLLLSAAKEGHAKVVALLLQIGVNINATDSERMTSLHLAATFGREGVIETLLIHGADIDAKGTLSDMTALHMATYFKQVKVLEILLSYGARVKTDEWDAIMNVKASNGKTVLHYACYYGHQNVVKELIARRNDINTKSAKSRTALHYATLGGHPRVVELLLKNDINVDDADENGASALHCAAQTGHTEIVHLLLTHDASVDLADNDKFTALHYAAAKGHEQVVALLAKHQTIIDKPGLWKITPLHLACVYGDKNIIEILIVRGANIKSQTEAGNTPLQLAVECNNNEIVKILQDHDVKNENDNKDT